jgi:CheY-like chemotaxis protein
MKRILILEPDADVRQLLGRALEALRYSPVIASPPQIEEMLDVDMLLVEPNWQPALDAAQRFRARRPGVPIVCASVRPLTDEAKALRPAEVLLKPFLLAELQRAVMSAFSPDPRSA